MERRQSTDSTSSITRGGGGSTGRLKRSISISTSRSRRNSRMEVVDMPAGGPVLVEVTEEDGQSAEGRRGSVEGARTLAGVIGEKETRLVDKIIKQEMAHHSPEVGTTREGMEVSDRVLEGPNIREEVGEGVDASLLALGATNLLHHLHLALASPALPRLPALAYKWSSADGSGFLAAYVVVLVLVAHPLSLLEQTLGQFSSLGPTTVFRCLPILTGVGVGMVCVCVVLMPYTSTVLSWALRYTLDCLLQELPWEDCPDDDDDGGTQEVNHTTSCPHDLSPSEYYFMRTLLGTSDVGAEDTPVNLILSLGLTQGLIWLALILAVWRGEAWRAGVVSRVWSVVTACMLVVLVAYGLQQPGSGDGLARVFIFNWVDLSRPDIWLDALGQVMWTVGPCIGLLINRASYRHFRDRIRLDAYTLVVANLMLAMVSCLAIFPFLSDPVEKTPGFFLVESSKAITSMEVPQVGGVILYLGLVKGLFDHAQILTYTVTVGISDLLPSRWRAGSRFFICCVAVCVMGFLSSLPFSTNEGVFLLRSLDTYAPWSSVLLIGALEVGGLVYIYGAKTIARHFRVMVRSEVNVMVYVWRFFLLPAIVALGVWACVVGVRGPVSWDYTYLSEEQEEGYRKAGVVIALLPTALTALVTLLLLARHTKNLGVLLVPTESWGPALAGHRAHYTPGILRAKAKTPYLVVQVENEESTEVPRKEWLPFGFYWVPSKSDAQLVSSTDGPNKLLLAEYLRSRFNDVMRETGNDDDDDEEEEQERQRKKGVVQRWIQTDVLAEVPQRSSTVSSGIVLQPGSLGDDKRLGSSAVLS